MSYCVFDVKSSCRILNKDVSAHYVFVFAEHLGHSHILLATFEKVRQTLFITETVSGIMCMQEFAVLQTLPSQDRAETINLLTEFSEAILIISKSFQSFFPAKVPKVCSF